MGRSEKKPEVSKPIRRVSIAAVVMLILSILAIFGWIRSGMVRDTFIAGSAGDGSRYMLVSFEGALLAGSGKPATVRGFGLSSVRLSNLPKELANSSRDIFNAEFGHGGKVSLAVPYPFALLFFTAIGSWLQSRHRSIGRKGCSHMVVSALVAVLAFAATAPPTSAGGKEPQDSRIVASLENTAGIYKCFSPDSSKLLAAVGNEARILDAGTLKPLIGNLQHDAEVLSGGFSADGKRVVTTSRGGTVRRWDATTGGQLGPAVKGQDGGDAAISPDGGRLLTIKDGKANLWDAGTVTMLREFERTGYVNGVAFSPDGKTAVVRSSSVAHLLDCESGKERISPLEDSSILKFSPDGKRSVTGAFVNERIWDASAGKLLWETKRGFGQVHSIEFSPDGGKIVIAADGDCRLWDAATGKPLAKSMCHRNTDANYARFSHDGKRVVICADSGGTGVWEVATGKKIMAIRGGPAYAAAFSQDDTHVTVAASDPDTHAELTTVWKIEPDVP